MQSCSTVFITRHFQSPPPTLFPLAITTTECVRIPLIFCWILSPFVASLVFAVCGAADILAYIFSLKHRFSSQFYLNRTLQDDSDIVMSPLGSSLPLRYHELLQF